MSSIKLDHFLMGKKEEITESGQNGNDPYE